MEELFRLPLDIAVPNILYAEELEKSHPELPRLGLRIMDISAKGIGAMDTFGRRYAKPGRNDLLALVLALEQGRGLLTGDGDLRAAAEAEDVDVHGTLWLMERFHVDLRLPIDVLQVAYEKMRHAGRRLPWPEVESQLARLRR